MEKVSKVHPDKVSVVCTNCSETLDPSRVVPREARREEFIAAVAVCEILAILLLELGVHRPGHTPCPGHLQAQEQGEHQVRQQVGGAGQHLEGEHGQCWAPESLVIECSGEDCH